MSNISNDDQEALLDAFKEYLYAEDSSRNTTSVRLSVIDTPGGVGSSKLVRLK